MSLNNVKTEYILCPICNINDTKPFLGIKDIVICRRCGLIYVNPRRSKDETLSFFAQKYIPNKQMLNKQFGIYRAETLKREANLVKSLRSEGKILDIGCAGGEFLEHFCSSKWKRFGIEPSLLAAKEATLHSIQVLGGSLGDSILPPKYFDIITCLDTLYFDPTPLEDLQRTYKGLKDDGFLIIEIPGLTYRIIRKYGPLSLILNHTWNDFNSSSPHLFYFSQSSLGKLLQKAGFVVIKTIPESSPIRGNILIRTISMLYFLCSKLLYYISFNKVNIAAKVIFVCQKI